MSGQALTAVQDQLKTANEWGQDAINAAKEATSALKELTFYTHQATNYGALNWQTFTPNVYAPPSTLNLDTAPDGIAISVPEQPSRPSTSEAELGTLHEITLPDIPTVSFPTLSVEAPVYSITAPAQWSFNPSQITIADDPLVATIKERLNDNITKGGSGLLPAVEDAIWARDKERAEQQLSDSIDKLIAVWATKGFSLPDGFLAHSISELQKEHMNKMIDRGRDITIKQAEMEQANIFKSMEIGINLIQQLISLSIQYEELIFKNNEATAKFANEYIAIQIQTYQAMVDAFKATAQVNEIIVRSEISKIELYKAQLEGQRLVGEINQQTIDVYKAKIAATSALIEQYKTDIQAMVATLEGEKLKVESNKVLFDIWAKKVEAHVARYNAETEVFKAGSQVSVATADFYSKQTEAQARINLEYAQLNMKGFEIEERSMNLKSNIILEAAKAVASATSTQAAGAMAALSVHSGLSYGETRALEKGE